MWMLLLLPFMGLLWVPFYNGTEPRVFGFPFFYWYQLAWVPLTALLTWIVYRAGGHASEDDGLPGEALPAATQVPPFQAPDAPGSATGRGGRA